MAIELRNSRGETVRIDPIELVEKVNREGIDMFVTFPEILPEKAELFEWSEKLVVPTANGIFNPETGKNEFCIPFWVGDLEDVKIERIFSDGNNHWQNPCNLCPKDRVWQWYTRPVYAAEKFIPIDELRNSSVAISTAPLGSVTISTPTDNEIFEWSLEKYDELMSKYSMFRLEFPGDGTLIVHVI